MYFDGRLIKPSGKNMQETSTAKIMAKIKALNVNIQTFGLLILDQQKAELKCREGKPRWLEGEGLSLMIFHDIVQDP